MSERCRARPLTELVGLAPSTEASRWEHLPALRHKKLHGLNASGRSPAAWSLERFKGLSALPTRGWDSITVPDAVSAWVALSDRHGKLPFADLFEPAIGYATDGYLSHHRAAVGEAGPRAARHSRIRRALHAERSRPGGGREIRRPGACEGAPAHCANEGRGFLQGGARRKKWYSSIT
jgi:gamma-glutamyltranspeptidase / glutathione hydrolase